MKISSFVLMAFFTRSWSVIFVTLSQMMIPEKCCNFSKFHLCEQLVTYTLTTVLNNAISHVVNFGFIVSF